MAAKKSSKKPAGKKTSTTKKTTASRTATTKQISKAEREQWLVITWFSLIVIFLVYVIAVYA